MKRMRWMRSAACVAAAAIFGVVWQAKAQSPGISVPDSVACNLRGGNCPILAPLTCGGSGIHANGTTCPTGTLIVSGNGWTCNPTGNGYCCGVSSCWMCYSGWLTCINP